MKKYILIILLLAVGILHAAASTGIVPKPNQMVVQSGAFRFDAKTRWQVESAEQKTVLSTLISDFGAASGWKYAPKTGQGFAKNTVVLVTNRTLASEAYQMTVTSSAIRLEASSNRGFFYAIQTLRQLLPAEINAGRLVSNVEWTVPCVTINDAPRLGYRGFMLDVSRYFMPKKDVLRLLDYLAYHKINYFHWHLVDDNGWRIEVKKYPRLTDVGAWRVDRPSPFPMRANPEPGEPTPNGGYYTQDDVREIVKYAQDRFIEIIPEIEMPAHTNSSLAAYPNLACPVVDHFIGVLPGGGGKNANAIYCAGNDSVFTFLEDVLSEIMTLFPSRYIHIGGDEANKETWEKCPRCQARMKANNIPNEEELQSYFIRRINKFLISNGKQLLGWDELVDSELPENSIIFGWRGLGHAAEKAGAKGFKYIKSPAVKYYLIRYQGPQWFEPYTYFGNTTLRDVYEYEPLSPSLPDSVAQNMIGVEACLWTEFVQNTNDAEYLIFPRLAAFAESAWTRPENKKWMDFVGRVDKLLLAYNFMGINYARSMFNLEHTVRAKGGKLLVDLNCIRPDVEIRYTTDGSEPSENSLLYKGKFLVNPGTKIQAVACLNGKRAGKVLRLDIIPNKMVGAEVVSREGNAFVLTNGLLGSEKITDGEWVDYYDRDAEFVIKMGSPSAFSQLKMGFLNNAGMGIYFPREIKISVSDDGRNFRSVFEKQYTETKRFQNGIFRSSQPFDVGEQKSQYLKVELKNPGICPASHVRAGQKTRIGIDEVLLF